MAASTPQPVSPGTGQDTDGYVQPPTIKKRYLESVPDVIHHTRFDALSTLQAHGLKADISGDLADDAWVSGQNPAGGTTAPRGSSVSITMAKPFPVGKWIAVIGGLGAVGAVVAVLARRRPLPGPIEDTVVVPPDPHSQTGEPLPLVTYSASVDVGRPTVRFSHEPKAAARALAVPVEKE
jgi:hypothetical protein